MKKIISVIVMFVMFGGILNAQESTFGKGDKVANLGIGLISGGSV